MAAPLIEHDTAKYDFKDSTEAYTYIVPPGLNEDVVRKISEVKGEPQWMLDFRLKSFRSFLKRPMPKWGGELSHIDFQKIQYYARPSEKGKGARTWEEVPDQIKKTFDRLGIPEAERKFLAGVGAQYESENVYHRIRDDLAKKGVVFAGPEEGLRDYPDIFKKYFATVIPPEDNKFSALNSAVWSGGSFVYIPPGVEVDMPLQAYFRINAANIGQFERTLIIADKGSKVHYIEGCTAPVYSTESLHSAVVEVVACEGAKVRYTTLQNWSNDVYNLVTKRAHAHKDSTVEWLDANVGSRLTMKYPSVYLVGENAKCEILSVAFAGNGQHQDTGAKAVHLAPNTQSRITSKSVSKGTGRTTYRGLLKVAKGATGVKSNVRCDALMLDNEARSDTYPYIEIDEDDTVITHEATVGKVGEAELFYLMSRGLSENDAMNLVVLGFLEIFTKELPMEYAVEFNRLIKLEMEGAVG
jgi:Fe-S cluster assembly protein SufB